MGEKILLLGKAMGQRLTDAGYTVCGAARTGHDYRLNLCSDADLMR